MIKRLTVALVMLIIALTGCSELKNSFDLFISGEKYCYRKVDYSMSYFEVCKALSLNSENTNYFDFQEVRETPEGFRTYKTYYKGDYRVSIYETSLAISFCDDELYSLDFSFNKCDKGLSDEIHAKLANVYGNPDEYIHDNNSDIYIWEKNESKLQLYIVKADDSYVVSISTVDLAKILP